MRYFSAPAVFKILINRITKPFMTLRQQQEYLVCNRRFPFLLYYCLHFPIATNRITKPNAANFNCKHKNGRHDFSCLPSYFYQYHAVKPHCYAICSAFSSPFHYPADSSDNAKGGTVSGDSPPLRSCFPASSQAL